MSEPASAAGASATLAAFVAAPHAGPAFDAVRESARARIEPARAALQRAGANASPLDRAFATGAALAGADAPIVAAALCAGEFAGGHDVAESIAVGREIAARLRRAVHFDSPWDATAVCAAIGATAAAACATGLDAAAARDAIGVAATQANGLGVVTATPAARIACGKAAADALEAVALARAGFTAAPASIEGRRGLAALMASRLDVAALCDGLGERWASAEDEP